jgi:hypothetical protein
MTESAINREVNTMSLLTSAKSSYEPIKPGTYSAVCTAMVDVGTMTGPFGSQQKIWIQWEVDEPNANNERYVISKLYTNSISSKSKLREHLEAWRGRKFTEEELRAFDLRNILCKPCLLTVGNQSKDGRIYDKVDAVGSLPRGMEPITPDRKILSFDMDEPELSVLDKLPEWLRKQIETAPEFNAKPPAATPADVDLDKSLPF